MFKINPKANTSTKDKTSLNSFKTQIQAPLEKNEQIAFKNWFELQFKPYFDMLFVNLEGVYIKDNWKYVGSIKKQGGKKKGRPDIEILIPNKNYHGLFIELKKTKGGRVTPEQKATIDNLNKYGYLAVVCKGWVEAKEITINYFRDI